MSPISEIDSDNIIWTKPNNQQLDFLLNTKTAQF